VFRDGIEFDGTMHEEQGFATRARLKVLRIDPKTGAIAARITSLSRPDVHRDFIGSCDPGGSSTVLSTTDKGSLDSSGDFGLPFLVGPAASTLDLTLSGGSVTGSIEGNPRWTIDFPIAAFLAAPSENPEPGSRAPGYSMLPPFPRKSGAYVLIRDGWSALPKNNGHVVTETLKEKSDIELPSNLVDAVEKGMNQLLKSKNKAKVSYLEFDGKDPVPEASSGAIVLLLVEADLPGKMRIELAPTETVKDGHRRLEILGEAPARVRFSELGLPSYAREAAPGIILVTTTSAPAPGAYALNADGGYELLQE
jgi:hypothetical protein